MKMKHTIIMKTKNKLKLTILELKMEIPSEHISKMIRVSFSLTNAFKFKYVEMQLCFMVEFYHYYDPSRFICGLV